MVIRRHNEIRDFIGDICSEVFHNIIRVPIVVEASENKPALVADLCVRRFWQSQSDYLIDVCVVDTDAPSYVNKSVQNVLDQAEKEEKRKYNEAAEFRRSSFTPFVISVDGALAPKARSFIR